jgi:hypothetical protein
VAAERNEMLFRMCLIASEAELQSNGTPLHTHSQDARTFQHSVVNSIALLKPVRKEGLYVLLFEKYVTMVHCHSISVV